MQRGKMTNSHAYLPDISSAGVSTIAANWLVAGRHRACPSAALDKNNYVLILNSINLSIAVFIASMNLCILCAGILVLHGLDITAPARNKSWA